MAQPEFRFEGDSQQKLTCKNILKFLKVYIKLHKNLKIPYLQELNLNFIKFLKNLKYLRKFKKYLRILRKI